MSAAQEPEDAVLGPVTSGRRRRRYLLGCVCLTALTVACTNDDTASGSSSRPTSDRPASSDATSTGGDATSTAGGGSGSTPLRIDPQPDLAAPAIVDHSDQFPLQVSDDGKDLLDRSGDPFLISGDAAWSLIVQLTDSEVDDYLRARRSMGFNTLLVNLIEHHYADDPPRDRNGIAPFADPGDFTHPVASYFDHAHRVIERARQLGFLVLLAPAYLGAKGGDDGWYADMVDAGADALRQYGEYIGRRFADLDNIIWVDGGDFTPPEKDLPLVRAVRDGMVAAGATQLRTAHWAPEDSSADLPADWIAVNSTYTYEPVYLKSSADDEAPYPHFVIESQYEKDIWDNTPQRLRAQLYEAVLTGGSGSVYGHGAIWPFTSTWRDALDSPGARDMQHGRALFDSLPWGQLVPDVRTNAVIPDIGKFGHDAVVVAAALPDRSLVVGYVPDERRVTVDLGGLTGVVSVRWYDPTSGEFRAADATVGEDGRVTVEHPGPNSDGDPDWILVLRKS